MLVYMLRNRGYLKTTAGVTLPVSEFVATIEHHFAKDVFGARIRMADGTDPVFQGLKLLFFRVANGFVFREFACYI